MVEAPTPSQVPLTVLVDDVRGFRDERPALVARSSRDALTLLKQLGDNRIDHLWLDHDLVGEDTIRPVVDWMVELASSGSPLNVGQIHVHSANVGAGFRVTADLRAAGYLVVRSHSLGMWTRGI